jgi:hypothetical protein
MSSIRKAVLFCAGLVAGAALMFVSQSMMALEPGSTVESFTAFLQRIQSDQVKEVTYTGGTGIAYVTSDGKSAAGARRVRRAYE